MPLQKAHKGLHAHVLESNEHQPHHKSGRGFLIFNHLNRRLDLVWLLLISATRYSPNIQIFYIQYLTFDFENQFACQVNIEYR